MKYTTVYELFRERVEQYEGREVFFVRGEGGWRGTSWEKFGEDVQAFASGLLTGGLTAGASVCVLMGNVPEWPVCDLGAIAAGGVGVGLYPTSSAEQCRYIIDHSGAEFVVVDTRAQLEKILSVRAELPRVREVIALDAAAAEGRAGVVGYDEFLRRGREAATDVAHVLRARSDALRLDDTAIMVYTSGTTGVPKGACLSHRYILNSVESLKGTIPIYDTDASFSYLPFCHVAERISGLYNRLYAGAPVYFVDDLSKLGQYMTEVRPTVFASLPRFFEKIHARVMSDLDGEPEEMRRRFLAALEVGREVVRCAQERREAPESLRAEYETRALPALARVKDYFGGRLRLATSGGAPLPTEIAEFFAAAGLPVLQAYGLTENVCVAFNRADRYKFGTVGPPMPGCEVKIASDGEILVRSRMMFSGYHREPEQTAEVMRDGWLLTGDLGELDDEGFLRITGRKKELIVTSTGKKVAPSLVENMIKEHHLVSHAFVYGEGRSYLVALITLNAAELADYARARGLAHESFTELARGPEIRTLVAGVVEAANRRLSSTEQVKRFRILEHDFQAEHDEVTPTLKLKRDVITRRYADALDELYA